MRFGDTFTQQLVGIAMGMSPDPPIANLYVAIHEAKEVLDYLNTSLLFYERFIDDGIGIWIHDNNATCDKNNWNKFKKIVNNGGLTWEFSDLQQSIPFMDMTIYIEGNNIKTDLFEKLLSLHLYVPLNHATHPKVLGA